MLGTQTMQDITYVHGTANKQASYTTSHQARAGVMQGTFSASPIVFPTTSAPIPYNPAQCNSIT